MLKEVMLGAGGIMLAAAIFASSMAPSGNSAAPAAVPGAAAPVAAPAAPSPVATQPTSPVFQDDSGDMQFGAPMIAAAPIETGDAAPISPAPEGSESTAGRQFTTKPGGPYPIPR